MIDQGLAPLSVIYRTFGAFPRTLIHYNKERQRPHVPHVSRCRSFFSFFLKPLNDKAFRHLRQIRCREIIPSLSKHIPRLPLKQKTFSSPSSNSLSRNSPFEVVTHLCSSCLSSCHLCRLARFSRYLAFCCAEPLPCAPVIYFFFFALVFTLSSSDFFFCPPRPKLMPFIRMSSKSLIILRFSFSSSSVRPWGRV